LLLSDVNIFLKRLLVLAPPAAADFDAVDGAAAAPFMPPAVLCAWSKKRAAP